MGPVPERARSGGPCARTTARTATPGTTSPRPRPVARLPLGRGRHRRDLRRPAAALLRAGAVERARSDPQGAPLRADRQRGQPRRGCEGVLLLPRQHADALLHEVPVQVSAARVSVRRPGRRATRQRTKQRASTSCSTPGVFDERPLLRRVRGVRQGHARRHPDAGHGVTIVDPSRRRLHLLPTLWFRNTWSWGRRARPSPACTQLDGRHGAHVEHPSSAHWTLKAEDAAQLLFCENETNNAAAVRGGQRVAVCRRTASTTTSCRGAARRREPGREPAPRSRPTTCSTLPGGRRAHDPPAAATRLEPRPASRSGADFDRVMHDAPAPRPTSSTPTVASRPASSDDRRDVHAPGAGRHAVEQAVLRLRRGIAGSTAIRRRPAATRRPARHGRNAPWFHMVNDDIISMPDKWEYPWFAAWDLAFHTLAARRSVDVGFRQGAARPDAAASCYLHPNGQIPAYEWNFSDVNPPVHAWATIFLYRTRAGATRHRATSSSSKRVFPQAAAELHLVGQPQGPRRQQPLRGRLPRPGQHRRLRPQRSAARPAAISSRPTARPGWRCSARTCSRSPSSWRGHDPCYEDMAHQVPRALPLDRHRDESRRRATPSMWDEEDGFYYDVLRMPDGRHNPAQGALDGRPAPAVRRHGVRARPAASGSRGCSSGHGVPRQRRGCLTVRAFLRVSPERAPHHVAGRRAAPAADPRTHAR